MNIFTSLRTRLIIAFLSVALISVAAVAIVTNQMARSIITEQAGKDLSTLAKSQATTVGNEIAKQIELLVNMSYGRSFQSMVNDANNKYLGDAAAIRTLITQLDNEWVEAVAANDTSDILIQSVLSNELKVELFAFSTASSAFLTLCMQITGPNVSVFIMSCFSLRLVIIVGCIKNPSPSIFSPPNKILAPFFFASSI